MDKKYSILYVDDEQSNLNVFYNTFRRKYKIYTALGAKEGLEIYKKEKIDLVISDQRMPEMNGVDFFKEIIGIYPDPNRILITAFTDFDAIKSAINEAKIFQYIQKPWDEEEVQEIINNALELYYLKKQNIELVDKLEEKNKELETLNKDLLELDNLKMEFLQIISHEIRTPLNGLLGATQLLKDVISKDDRDLFRMLEGSAARLEKFLLKAEKITHLKASKGLIKLEEIDLNLLLENIIKKLKPETDKKQIKIIYDNAVSHTLNADMSLVSLSVYELLINAIYHSCENSIIYLKQEVENNYFYLEVVDNGCGFPEKALNNLTNMFASRHSMGQQGTGLSIPLIHLIMDAHDGSISVHNNENNGATVRLKFPKRI